MGLLTHEKLGLSTHQFSGKESQASMSTLRQMV